MTSSRWLMAWAVIVIALCGQQAWSQGRRALVIGNWQYPLSPLNTPQKDAPDVAAKLKSMGFDVLVYENLTRSELVKAVRNYAATLKSGDLSLVYYTGHGMQLRTENYLVPIDFNSGSQADAEDDAYKESRLLANITEFAPSMSIVILDACRNNPFAPGKSLAKGLAPPGPVAHGAMVLLFYATSPGKTAEDGDPGTNGVFARSLLRHIGKSNIDVEKVFRMISEEVATQTKNTQLPWRVSSILNDVYLGTGVNPVVVLTPEELKLKCGASTTADAVDVDACMDLGRMSEEGKGLARSRSVADSYYSRACRMGHIGGCAKHASIVGCSDGTREALQDVELFPEIAACGARWPMGSLRAPKSGVVCGSDRICPVAADACAAGWHVCGGDGIGAADLRARLTADQCRGLSPGGFVSALGDQDCDSCQTGGGFGAVCCGETCVQQNGSCVWPSKTAWFGVVENHVQSCGDIEMKWDIQRFGVMCCRDAPAPPSTAPKPTLKSHPKKVEKA